jgi:hypothetical protein
VRRRADTMRVVFTTTLVFIGLGLVYIFVIGFLQR